MLMFSAIERRLVSRKFYLCNSSSVKIDSTMSSDCLSIHDKAVLSAIFNPNLPLNDLVAEAAVDLTDYEKNTEEILQSKKLETEGIKKAEMGDFDVSLSIFISAIEALPQRASLYNNRAQVYQLKKEFDAAFADLTKCISLCDDKLKKTKCQAFCQRGMLYRKSEQDDLARKDFQEAATLGSSFAKMQLVELNPYAAMCNQMLQKMIANERGEMN